VQQTGIAASATVAGPCPHTGVTVPFDTIASPGTYVCTWSGHLLRVPRGCVDAGQSLGVNLVGREPLMVTKISDDPELPLTRARALAAELGLSAGF